jgi:hypothetical protein
LAPTVGIAATGFCYPGGILQLFHRQDQQILWLPTEAAISFLAGSSASTPSNSSSNITFARSDMWYSWSNPKEFRCVSDSSDQQEQDFKFPTEIDPSNHTQGGMLFSRTQP